MKIYITGCARTGTTLVKNLFYAFKDMDVVDPEISMDIMAGAQEGEGRHLCCKRDQNAIFSAILEPAEISRQIKLIKREGMRIVNCLRQQNGVMKTGRGMEVTADRWKACVEQALQYKHHVDVGISYEALCEDMDSHQEEVAEALGLEIDRKWSEYPDFVPDNAFNIIDLKKFPGYGRRPIERHIGKYEKRMESDDEG